MDTLFDMLNYTIIDSTIDSYGPNVYKSFVSSIKIDDYDYSKRFNDSMVGLPGVEYYYQNERRGSHDLKLASASPSFTCERLPAHYDPTMFCSGVVDYSFMLSSGLTKEQLEAIVRMESQRAISLATTQCKSDIKRLICAKYYLPCVDNVVADDYTTYQMVGSIPVPFKRPCMSLCTATTFFGNANSCHGLLESLGLNFDCTANAYGLPFSEFDNSNDPLVCNALQSTQSTVVVASPVEPYIGEACTGISEKYFVTPPFDPSFAPLLPPFVAQSFAEATVASIIDAVPRFFESDCLEAAHKVYCATLVMKPFQSHALDLFFGPTYFPSFPAKSLCENYNDKCNQLIAMVPAAELNCKQLVPGTVLELYPENNQTLAAIPIGQSLVIIETPPNSLEGVDIEVATECPMFWDVPNEIIGTEIMIGGCAMVCGNGYVTLPTEVAQSDLYSFIIACIIYLATTTNLIVTPAKKRNVYSCIIIFVKVVGCIIIGIHKGTTNDVTLLCETKTASYKAPVNDFAGGICMAEGVSYFIIQLIVVACVYCAILELWFRVVWSIKDITRIQRIYRCCAVGLVLMHTMIYYFGAGEMRLDGIYGHCWYVVADKDKQFFSFFIPQLFYYVTGLALSFNVIYVCITISLRSSNKAERWYFKMYKFWKLYKILFLIVAVFFMANFSTLFIKETFLYDNLDGYRDSIIEFTLCLFTSFTSYEKNSNLQTCGILPKKYLSGYHIIFFNIFQYINDYLWFFITLNNDVRTFWFTKFQLVVGKGSQLFKVRATESSVYHSESSSKDDDDDDEVAVELSQQEKPAVMVSSRFNDKIVPLDVESANTHNVIDYESKHCEN